MSEHDQPNLDDVLPVDEQATPDARAHLDSGPGGHEQHDHAHGKQPKHPNDDELEHRVEQERDETSS